MALFNRLKFRDRDFIKTPVYDPKNPRVYKLYDFINIQPISMDQLAKQGAYDNGVELCKVGAACAQNANFMLYRVPAVRKYFTNDYINGFEVHVVKEGTTPYISYQNLDDTAQSIQYTKEMTAIIQRALYHILENLDLYLFYDGDKVWIKKADDLEKGTYFKDHRILWAEE